MTPTLVTPTLVTPTLVTPTLVTPTLVTTGPDRAPVLHSAEPALVTPVAGSSTKHPSPPAPAILPVLEPALRLVPRSTVLAVLQVAVLQVAVLQVAVLQVAVILGCRKKR